MQPSLLPIRLGLDGIPYLKFSYSFVQSLEIIEGFARDKGVQLLIIIDQFHRKLTYAEALIRALPGLSSSDREEHRVIVSSSTSGTTDSVFPDFYIPLRVFDHFLSDSELELLRDHYQASANLGRVLGLPTASGSTPPTDQARSSLAMSPT